MPARAQECRARVTAVRSLTAEILEADLALEDPATLAFEAGQWVSVPFGPKIVRAYSLASPPRSPGRITLCADVAPGGIGSAWFRDLRPDQEVRFKGPLGGFIFSRADVRRPVFVAEEIGIVPIRSILTELYETGFGRPTTLVYAARDPSWLAYDAEFHSLARRFPEFSYHPLAESVVSRASPLASQAAAAVDRLVTDVNDLLAYVSGGGTTIDRVREVLVAKGMDRKAVKWEKFW
jgi:ferredoxin-NADP reductase